MLSSALILGFTGLDLAESTNQKALSFLISCGLTYLQAALVIQWKCVQVASLEDSVLNDPYKVRLHKNKEYLRSRLATFGINEHEVLEPLPGGMPWIVMDFNMDRAPFVERMESLRPSDALLSLCQNYLWRTLMRPQITQAEYLAFLADLPALDTPEEMTLAEFYRRDKEWLNLVGWKTLQSRPFLDWQPADHRITRDLDRIHCENRLRFTTNNTDFDWLLRGSSDIGSTIAFIGSRAPLNQIAQRLYPIMTEGLLAGVVPMTLHRGPGNMRIDSPKTPEGIQFILLETPESPGGRNFGGGTSLLDEAADFIGAVGIADLRLEIRTLKSRKGQPGDKTTLPLHASEV